MKILRIALVLLVALAVATPALAQQKKRPGKSGSSNARMYKCVDEKGKLFYTDNARICEDGVEMTRQGVVIQKKGEKTQSGDLKPLKEDAKKMEAAAAARRDRALLATYTSEAEIDVARDRSLVMPMQGIKSTETRLEKSNKELFELKQQADTLASQQKPLPAHLLEDVGSKQKEVSGLEADVLKRKAEADVIRKRYEADKVRFRELKSTNVSASASAN